MKLPNFHESGLSNVRKKIWANLIIYNIKWWDIREPEIIAIDPTSIKIWRDNTITNKDGDKIIIHIRDVIPFRWEYNIPKIHFYNCRTIIQKMDNNTFDSRYVWTYTITWMLEINLMWKNKEDIEETKNIELWVCSNCLKDAQKDWFIDNELLNPFSLKKYFDFYEYYRNRVNHPKYNFLNIVKNQYPKSWDEISRNEREKVWYICQDCSKDCKSDKWNLHVHHKDHNKWNNFTDNFEVLCFDCHAKHHPHIQKWLF
jgi:hypothetical protein